MKVLMNGSDVISASATNFVQFYLKKSIFRQNGWCKKFYGVQASIDVNFKKYSKRPEAGIS